MQISRPRTVVWIVLAVAVLAFTAAFIYATSTVDAMPAAAAGVVAGPMQQPVSPGNIVVRGRIFYIDRNSDRSHTAAGLKVEVYDKDERSFGTAELLYTTVTDAQGFFETGEIPNVDPDGPTGDPEGTQDVFLKLYTDNGSVRVYDADSGRPFVWASYQIDERDGLLKNVPDGTVGMPPLYVMENTRNVEALWTYVNLIEGWNYLQGRSGGDPGPVTAYWSATAGDGPRYDPQRRAIFLRDSDAGFADVVVQQEAYALLHNAYGELPAGWSACTAGPTEGIKEASDAPCAFVQGFATAFPLAVYDHTEFDSYAYRGIDFDKLAPTTSGWGTGDTVSGRVAGAFWDLGEADDTDEQYDLTNATFARVWSVIAARHPQTMREWWQGWVAMGLDACGAAGSLFQNSIDYNTAPTVASMPDLVLDEDTSARLDLLDYVQDKECPDTSLRLALTSAGATEAGVTLESTGAISVTPAADWFGSTTVRLTVSDGPATVPFSLRVVVRPINDCPVIAPRIDGKQVRYLQPIVLDLLRNGKDVEDSPFDLKWYASFETQDAKDVSVDGEGTSTLTFHMNAEVIDARNVRAVITVEDTAGCRTDQPVFLSWTARPNQPPTIWWDRLTRSYMALKNTDITVDLRGVATDDEDKPEVLQWRVANELEHAGWGYVDPDDKQTLNFHPHPDYLGSQVADLQVADATGAIAPIPPTTAVITLTWVSREVYENLPPYILRNRLAGKTVGVGASACYDLADKAEDPDDPQTSLRWFVVGYDARDVDITGQGSRWVCIQPSRQRIGFEGCFTHRLIVQDPKNAESEPAEITTCWRDIHIMLPFAQRTRR
jgi:hypothetical protein